MILKLFAPSILILNCFSSYLFILVLLNSTPTNAQKTDFKNISVSDGLSHSTVYDITQDSYGKMWFGTREGLNSFDGIEVKVFYHDTLDNFSISNNQINTIENLNGGLYIGTFSGLDKYDPESGRFIKILPKKNENTSVNNIIETDNDKYIATNNGLYVIRKNGNIDHYFENSYVRDIEPFKANIYWLALGQKILLINNLGETIKQFSIPTTPLNPSDASPYTIQTLFTDSNNQLWMGTSRGLFYYDNKSESFEGIQFTSNDKIETQVIRDITEDKEGNLWIGTEYGIFIYNLKNKTSVNYNQSFSSQASTLTDKSIYSIFVSQEDIVWIGTYFGGVNYTENDSSSIIKFLPSDYTNSISGKAISQLIEIDNELWIGTEDGGISILDKNTNQFKFLNTSNGLSSNNIHAITQGKDDKIWIGTFLGGLNQYDKKTESIKRYLNHAKDPTSISNNFIYAIKEDNSGRLWIGTQNGLNLFNRTNESFTLFKSEIFGNKFIYSILEDHENNLWFCTRNNGIYKLDTKTNSVEAMGPEHGQIINAYQDSKHNIWFGTLGQGVLIKEAKNKKIVPFSLNNKLPSTTVYGFLEDETGRIWITTNQGINIFLTNDKQLYQLGVEDGLSTNQFNFKSTYRDDEGKLYFGSIKGLNVIEPTAINFLPATHHIVFNEFQLFNKKVPITSDGILKKHINQVEKIQLDHDQNVFTIEYGAINYKTAEALKYAYKLEGFDKNWNEVGAQRSATYTNLAPGDYTFKVQTLPLTENNEQKTVAITVHPPFWQTSWAYILYCIIGIILIYAYWRFVRFVHVQKLAVQMERIEKEKIKEVNQHKLNFFTFISHEFKTPLTLIIASVEKYYKEKINRASPPEELISIKKNANKLHQLIHQLLEFRKIETDHAKLELKKGDIIIFINDTFNAFKPLFDIKRITAKFIHEIPEYQCYFDPTKVEMITTNLISNAIKNTPEEGDFTLKVDIDNALDASKRSRIHLLFKDNGDGISTDMIVKATEPFFKHNEDKSSSNSGLGLALVNSLTQFLEGEFELRSELGKGTVAQISFPLLLKPQDEDKVIEIKGNKTLHVASDLLLSNLESQELGAIKSKTNLKVMIVEDNLELRRFLQKHFTNKFNVVTANDGEHAVEKMTQHHPDIIISDLKMPKLSGIQLCKKIKSNPDTKHIPFVLLTAKGEESLKFEALSSGANAYIAKPFDLKELDLLVINLLETRKNLEKRFSNLKSDEQKDLPNNNQDNEFLKRINELVEKHYSNPKFSVTMLADEMGISRSLLHLKLKKIIDMSALEFIKKERMNRATSLINQGKNISEVAYKVGYADPNYFSRAFKKEFGITPSQYNNDGK